MPAEPQTLIEAVRHFGDLARCEMLWSARGVAGITRPAGISGILPESTCQNRLIPATPSAREYLDCHTLPGVSTPADLAVPA
jgi:hypothetical protein